MGSRLPGAAAGIPEEHYHRMAFERCEQDDHRIVAVFANGERIEGDLLVGADGMRSTCGGSSCLKSRRYAGYVRGAGWLRGPGPVHWLTDVPGHGVLPARW